VCVRQGPPGIRNPTFETDEIVYGHLAMWVLEELRNQMRWWSNTDCQSRGVSTCCGLNVCPLPNSCCTSISSATVLGKGTDEEVFRLRALSSWMDECGYHRSGFLVKGWVPAPPSLTCTHSLMHTHFLFNIYTRKFLPQCYDIARKSSSDVAIRSWISQTPEKWERNLFSL
jgi:hypothetical protein